MRGKLPHWVMGFLEPSKYYFPSMSGVNYEIQSRRLHTYKHTLDYEMCRKKYNHYASMELPRFIDCLKNREQLGEIGHLASFVLWFKNKKNPQYREALSDYGLVHLLFHCVENKVNADIHGEYIHYLFKEDIKLV